MRNLALLLIALGAPPPSGTLLAQEPAPADDVRILEVRAEPEAPSLGEPFELYIALRVPFAAASLSDTLLGAEDVVGLGPGAWRDSPARGDSVELRATYPAVGFREGTLPLPALELWISPPGARGPESQDAGRQAPDAGAREGPAAEPRRLIVPLGEILIGPYAPIAAEGAELVPRPAADVAGGNRSVWFLLAVGLVGALAVGAAAAFGRRWWVTSGATRLDRLRGRTPRQRALRELDRVGALDWHRNGRMVDFYTASTDALRRFGEDVVPGGGPALTSSELLTRLEQRWGEDQVERLVPAVAVAERVKFGSHRPDPESAERDWRTIRDWLEAAPEG